MGGKRLITESDVRALARGAELVVAPDTIVTPAAVDLAFERHVRLVRAKSQPAGEGAGCGCGASCSGPGGCAWRQLLAVDGVHVVVVKNGVPSITTLTERGPVPFTPPR